MLSNATSVDVSDVAASGTRRKDIVFAGRLLPWKGGRLAVRALRYVHHPDAMLRIFGEGSERRRILRAARRWGVSDRVRFEGRVRRDDLLQMVATAGVLLHPAFHDEAGLAVAEHPRSARLSYVSLAEGRRSSSVIGPAPTPSSGTAAVLGQHCAGTRCGDSKFLFDPPPVPDAPRRSVTSFEQELLAGYDAAYLMGRDRVRHLTKVWAFPAGKPQVFADTPQALSKGVMVYGFGRRLPRWVQTGLALQVRVPVIRRLFVERTLGPAPICGWTAWSAINEEVQRNCRSSLKWIHFHSQWDKARLSMLGLNPNGTACLFVVVEPETPGNIHGRVQSTRSFRVTECTGRSLMRAGRCGSTNRCHDFTGPQPGTRNGCGEWLKTCHWRSKACSHACPASQLTGGRCMVTTSRGTCGRTTAGSCGCWIGKTQVGGLLLADLVRYVVADRSLAGIDPGAGLPASSEASSPGNQPRPSAKFRRSGCHTRTFRSATTTEP